MKIQINITKAHLLFLLLILLLFITSLSIAQTSLNFGHIYDELDLSNSIRTSDIRNNEITSQDIKDREIMADDIKFSNGFAELSVQRSRIADDADAASCEFIIIRCNGNPVSYGCRQGYKQMPGSLSIQGTAIDYRYAEGSNIGICTNTNGNSWLSICCKER